MHRIALVLALAAAVITPLHANSLDTAQALAQQELPQVTAWRRDIHQHPELSNREVRTSALVAQELKKLGLEVHTGIAHTGVVGLLKGDLPGPRLAIRADMDALPVTEEVNLPFASKAKGEYRGKIVGVMHACGHDAHTAMLVQAVHLLHRHRDELPGTVKFMFQPGEEGHAGARRMIEDGLLDADPKPDAAFALHIFPNFKAGAIAGRPGPLLASVDTWTIKVKGRGGHASMPYLAVDPVPVACEIGLALHTMVTRRTNVFDPVVLTLGKIAGGTASNIIPEVVDMLGTLRTTSENAREIAQEGIRRVAVNIAAAHSCEAHVQIRRGYPVTVNDAGFVDFARGVATDLVGADNYIPMPAPFMGAEDFSYVLQRMPGCMMFLGVMPEDHHDHAHVPSCHSNHMVLNEDAMAVGIAMHAAVAHRYLTEAPPA
jgi:amidohydrolase